MSESYVLVNKENLDALGDAVRSATGTNYTLSGTELTEQATSVLSSVMRGDSVTEVSIGSTKPSDLNVSLWIDTNTDTLKYRTGASTFETVASLNIDTTVGNWARTTSKPTYTANEVGAATKNHTHASFDDVAIEELEAENLSAASAVLHNASFTSQPNGLYTYSTEEQFTGQYWIDGKPIYKRVFMATGNLANGYAMTSNFVGYDTIIDVYGMLQRADNTFMQLSTGCPTATYCTYVEVTPSKNEINFYKGTSITTTRVHVIVEYTKIDQ